jgi:hypothetical protein
MDSLHAAAQGSIAEFLSAAFLSGNFQLPLIIVCRIWMLDLLTMDNAAILQVD